MRGRHLTFACFVAVLGLVLAIGHVPVAAQEFAAETDSINATPTKKAGVYHVSPVFKHLDKVIAIKRGGPYGPPHTRTLVAGNEWGFDKATGKLTISVPIDNETRMISVRGVRVRPWAWRMPGKLDSVRVLLGDRVGVRGVDFEYDAETGVIRFLKDELCDKRRDYYISYGFTSGKGGAIGNHNDRAAVRRFMGIDESIAKPTLGAVGTGGVATADPRVFFLVRPFAAEGTRVAIVKRSETGKPRWLETGTHYTYDGDGGTITLRGDVRVDKKTEMLFVHGTPRVRNVFQFKRKVEAGAAHVIIGDKKLVEGTGFRVDYARGVVTVLDPAIKKLDVKFYVTVGSMSFGNHDVKVVRRLLEPGVD